MKKLFLLLTILLCQMAHALPVVDENSASYGMITIYPDHENQHRYYMAPNVVILTTDQNGVPYFSYMEYRSGLWDTLGTMTMTLTPVFSQVDLQAAKDAILKKDPAAEFSSVPFISSSLQLTGDLEALIDDNQCNHDGGLIGQEQACSLTLTSRGRRAFLDAIDNKKLFVTLNFSYQVQAVVKNADNTYSNQIIHHSMAVRIDGAQLSQYPQLISRR